MLAEETVEKWIKENFKTIASYTRRPHACEILEKAKISDRKIRSGARDGVKGFTVKGKLLDRGGAHGLHSTPQVTYCTLQMGGFLSCINITFIFKKCCVRKKKNQPACSSLFKHDHY